MASKLFMLIALTGIIQLASSTSGHFAADLFSQISKTKTSENVIISPISIQTALAMLYLGAEGETASELVQGLRLPSSDKDEVGKSFAEILNAKNGEVKLKIANRLYVSSTSKLRSNFNQRAQKYFNSKAKIMNFGQSSNAIQTINDWVEEKTNNKITNLLQPGSVDGRTSAIIVNAIYFKGKWQTPFSSDSTVTNPFWVSQTKSVEADTMYASGERFKYADLPELEATVLEMPYRESNISMLIILPRERDGLARLEQKLSSVAINELSSQLRYEIVNVALPKFKIEFTTGLVDALKELSIRSIFDDTANLSGIVQSGPRLRVSDVQHKAFIDVNEAGSEAAAASFVQIVPLSLNLNQKDFIADHPFVFAIKNSNTVYFVGHVAKV